MAPRRIGFLVGTALTVLILDLVSKLIVVATLQGHPQIRLLGGFLTLLVTRNSGAAFSIGTSMTLVFSAIAIGVIVVILRTSRRIRSISWAVTLGLLLGGATGNLIDRIFRYPGLFRGYVVDWIELPHWPVFNLADSAIVCGGVLAVLLSARGIRLDGSRATTDPPDDQESPDSANKGAPATPDERADADSADDGAADDQSAPGSPPRGGNSGGGNSGGGNSGGGG
ncbi:MAG: signal peptidase II [Streptosporangiaceae bacterium]